MTPYLTLLYRKPAISLDAVSERFLCEIALMNSAGGCMRVLQAMRCLPEISTTTAHRKLSAMVKTGWLQLRHDKDDRRIKYVEPGRKARDYFAKMSAAMEAAVKGDGK